MPYRAVPITTICYQIWNFRMTLIDIDPWTTTQDTKGKTQTAARQLKATRRFANIFTRHFAEHSGALTRRRRRQRSPASLSLSISLPFFSPRSSSDKTTTKYSHCNQLLPETGRQFHTEIQSCESFSQALMLKKRTSANLYHRIEDFRFPHLNFFVYVNLTYRATIRK